MAASKVKCGTLHVQLFLEGHYDTPCCYFHHLTMSACLQAPVSTSQTRMEVSSEPETTCTPSNCSEYTRFVCPEKRESE